MNLPMNWWYFLWNFIGNFIGKLHLQAFVKLALWNERLTFEKCSCLQGSHRTVKEHSLTSLGSGNDSSYTATIYFFLCHSGQSWTGTTCTYYMYISVHISQNWYPVVLLITQCDINAICMAGNFWVEKNETKPETLATWTFVCRCFIQILFLFL